MKRTTMLMIGVAAFATGFVMPGDAVQAQAPDSPIVGSWQGTLQGVGLRLVVNIKAGEGGALTATLDSPDQNTTGIPVSSVTFADSVLKLESAVIGGQYEGRLGQDGKLTGEWRQGGARFALVLEKGAPPERAPRPQEPKPPLPYSAEDVTFRNAPAGITLAGTYTRPRGAGPFPAVALVSGSGAQDRDETLLGHKPFLVLADHLTRQGIAVLRYDDRGVGRSGGNFATATTQDFASDAMAAVAWLKARPEIDDAAVGIIGHSEGGLVGPLAAVRSQDVRFVVMLAGPGVTGEEILYEQGRLIAAASGVPPSAIEKNLAMQRSTFAVLKSESDPAAAEQGIRTVLRTGIDSLSEQERVAMGLAGDIDTIVEAQARRIASPWFRWFLTYDPRPTLAQVRVPVLALFGDLDLQVPPDQNVAPLEAALRRAGNRDVTVRRLPGLNHLFQTARTGSPSEYNGIEETFAPAALEIVSSWIRERFVK